MKNVKELRNKLGLSQIELAVKAGISAATLISIEKGTGNPNKSTLRCIAQALGIDVEQLKGD